MGPAWELQRQRETLQGMGEAPTQRPPRGIAFPGEPGSAFLLNLQSALSIGLCQICHL